MRLIAVIFSMILALNLPAEDQRRASWDSSKPMLFKYVPVALSGESTLTLVTPDDLQEVSALVGKHLKFIYYNLEQVFGDIPAMNIQVHFLPEAEYYKETGAPEWTNAIFYKNEIMVPVRDSFDVEALNRTIRHEFTHAVVDELSGGKCPGWLDEGLAQWAEGTENPALEPALRKWLANSEPVSLNLLSGGFTGLPNAMVPAAYAQSLFAANALISTFGFDKLGNFMRNLKAGMTNDAAFQASFEMDGQEFERRLKDTLKYWQGSTTLETNAQALPANTKQ